MKVLLADDHTLFREGLRLVLESLVNGPLEIVEANDYLQALALVSKDSCIEIGLIDLNMPGMDRFDGIASLKSASDDLQVIVISASNDTDDVRRAFECGASGFVSKSASSAAMIQAIRLVLEGETFFSPPIPILDESAINLTPRQRDVLAMVREGKSNKEIARDLHLAEITVKLHVTAILRVLGVENRTQAAIFAAKSR